MSADRDQAGDDENAHRYKRSQTPHVDDYNAWAGCFRLYAAADFRCCQAQSERPLVETQLK
jgi:hypothetical protein